MQVAFDFGAADDLTWMRDRLSDHFGPVGPIGVRTPIGQLVKSSISGRTRDAVSLVAYHRLTQLYPTWDELARAPAHDIEAAIRDVTFPDVKARHLGEALRTIARTHPDYDLTFLRDLGVSQALAWLERLTGVGRKVAASTLNFSTLHMPAFVVDTHILRILRRYGLVRDKADTHSAFDTAMEVSPSWSARELAELHVLMKRLGQTICRVDRACCPACPLRERCEAAGRAGQAATVGSA